MSRSPSILALPRILLAALTAAFRRPGVIALFLLLNLGIAMVLAAPLQALLASQLDDNLYGEAMAEGASWRWFDTVERQHPEAVGDYSPWTAFLSPEGVGFQDLAAASGPAATVLLAGFLLFLLHGVLHVGYLAARLGERPGVSHLVAAGFARGPAALLLGLLAASAYATVYALLYVLPAAPLGRLAEFFHSATLDLAQTWLRLGVTFLAFLAVKVFFDLAKLGLAEAGMESSPSNTRGERLTFGGLGNLATAFRRAVAEALRRGVLYLLAGGILWTTTGLLAMLWWWISAPLIPATWLGLTLLFLLHQLFVATRIGLRLAQLDAVGIISGSIPETNSIGDSETPSFRE